MSKVEVDTIDTTSSGSHLLLVVQIVQLLQAAGKTFKVEKKQQV